MEKKAREKMFDKLNNNESHDLYEGCPIGDRQCLINEIFKSIHSDAVDELKKKLFDVEIMKIMQDAELMRCVNEFFNNNLNISETSRNAFLHRNTLIYRIEKIHKATGFNVKNFNDAVSFKILEMLYHTLGKDKNEQ